MLCIAHTVIVCIVHGRLGSCALCVGECNIRYAVVLINSEFEAPLLPPA